MEHRAAGPDKSAQEGNFGDQIRELKGDAVIDMICYKPESARQIVEALRGQVQFYLQCGTLWVSSLRL